MAKETAPVEARKSNAARRVSLTLRVDSGWGFGHRKVAVLGYVDVTTDQARAIADQLIQQADAADARAAARAAQEARRKAWRDREIAAGRMIVLGGLR